MEMLKEMLFSGNIIAWVILLVLFILILKFIKSMGKGLLIFIGIVILWFILAKFFPTLIAPIVEFIQGSWLDQG